MFINGVPQCRFPAKTLTALGTQSVHSKSQSKDYNNMMSQVLTCLYRGGKPIEKRCQLVFYVLRMDRKLLLAAFEPSVTTVNHDYSSSY